MYRENRKSQESMAAPSTERSVLPAGLYEGASLPDESCLQRGPSTKQAVNSLYAARNGPGHCSLRHLVNDRGSGPRWKREDSRDRRDRRLAARLTHGVLGQRERIGKRARRTRLRIVINSRRCGAHVIITGKEASAGGG